MVFLGEAILILIFFLFFWYIIARITFGGSRISSWDEEVKVVWFITSILFWIVCSAILGGIQAVQYFHGG